MLLKMNVQFAAATGSSRSDAVAAAKVALKTADAAALAPSSTASWSFAQAASLLVTGELPPKAGVPLAAIAERIVDPAEVLAVYADLWSFAPSYFGSSSARALARGAATEKGWIIARAAPQQDAPVAVKLNGTLTLTLRGRPCSVLSSRSPHTVILTGAAPTLVIPRSTLQGGFVYTASITAKLDAAWVFNGVVAAAGAGGAPSLQAASTVASPASVAAKNIFVADDRVSSWSMESARQPLIYAHFPPATGILEASPSSGTELVTVFKLESRNWSSVDGIVLSPAAELAAPPGSLLTTPSAAACDSVVGSAAAGESWAAAIESAAAALGTDASKLCASANAMRAAGGARVSFPSFSASSLSYGFFYSYASAIGAASGVPSALRLTGLSAMLNTTLNTADGSGGTLLLYATATDDWGSVGSTASVPVKLAPPAPSTAVALNIASSFIEEAAYGQNPIEVVAARAAAVMGQLNSVAGTGSASTVAQVSRAQTNVLVAFVAALPNGASAPLSAAAARVVTAALATAAAGAAGPAPGSRSNDGAAIAALAGVRAIIVSGGLSNTTAPALLSALSSAAALGTTKASSFSLSVSPPGATPPALGAEVKVTPLATSGLSSLAAAVDALNSVAALGAASLLNGGTGVLSTASKAAVSRADLPIAPYCGPALIVASSKITAGTTRVAIANSLNPCYATAGGVATAAASLSVPETLVAAQPSPAVTLNDALAGLLGADGGTSLSVTQWGVSPFNETAGLSALMYAAPTAISDLDAQADAAAASAANSRSRRLNLWAAVQAAVQGTGGKTAKQAAANNLALFAPRATSVPDMNPFRGLDSRVVSVSLTGSDGNPRTLTSGKNSSSSVIGGDAIIVTVPLRDPSILIWNASTQQVDGVDAGQSAFSSASLDVVCPSSPQDAYRGVAAFDRASLKPVAVNVTGIQFHNFSSAVGAVISSSQVKDESLSSFAGATSSTVNVLNDFPDDTNSSVSAAKSNVIVQRAYSYILSTDCGPAFGSRAFVCGPGAKSVTFDCPKATSVPTCIAFDTTKGRWRSDVCTVASVGVSSVNCACKVSGSFSVALRYAVLPQVQADVFGSKDLVTSERPFSVAWAVFALSVIICTANFYGACCLGGARGLRTESTRRFIDAIAADDTVRALITHDPDFVLAHTDRLLGHKSGAAVGIAPAAPASDQASPARLQMPAPGGLPTPTAKVIPVTGAHAELTEPFQPSSDLPRLLSAMAFRARILQPSPIIREGFSIRDESAAEKLLAIWRVDVAAAQTRRVLNVFSAARDAIRVGCARRSCHIRPPSALVAVAPIALALKRRGEHFHPELAAMAPESTVFLIAALGLTCGLAGIAALYANVVQPNATAALPELSASGVFALCFAALLLVVVPLDYVLSLTLARAARARMALLFPGLAKESARRAAVSVVTSQISTCDLLAAMDASLSLSDRDRELLDSGRVVQPAPRSEASSVDEGLRIGASMRVASSKAVIQPSAAINSNRAIDAALLAALAVSLLYGIAFMLFRGAAASSGVVGVWFLCMTFNAIVSPLLSAVRILALMMGDGVEKYITSAPAQDAAALDLWTEAILLPRASSSAAGGVDDTAIIALAPIVSVAAAWRLANGVSFGAAPRDSLRAAVLAHFYARHVLRSNDQVAMDAAAVTQGTRFIEALAKEGAAAPEASAVPEPSAALEPSASRPLSAATAVSATTARTDPRSVISEPLRTHFGGLNLAHGESGLAVTRFDDFMKEAGDLPVLPPPAATPAQAHAAATKSAAFPLVTVPVGGLRGAAGLARAGASSITPLEKPLP
jgi:hypothetical protein